jgi:hypothetical protein
MSDFREEYHSAENASIKMRYLFISFLSVSYTLLFILIHFLPLHKYLFLQLLR